MDMIDNVLGFDPVASTEKEVGNKHWSEFNDDEIIMALKLNMIHNQFKTEMLKDSEDTYFSMDWDEFISLIEKNGFKYGLKYDINHDDIIDEAIVYYREDGLILWATSYNNKKSVNGGTVYGEFTYEKWGEVVWNALDRCSHGSVGENTNCHEFSYDVREGLFHKINKIASVTNLNATWKDRSKFLWFVDYVENKVEGYDYESITQKKIELLPEAARKIIGR